MVPALSGLGVSKILPIISIVGLTIPVGPLAFILAFFVGSEVGARSLARAAPAQQRSEWQAAFNSAAFAALLAGLVGARIGYATEFYPLYVDSPRMLLSLQPGTLALIPGLLAAGAAGMFVFVRKDISVAHIADATAIGAVGGLLVLSIGHFLTGSGYGLPTEVPWGVELWGLSRHPVQLYQATVLFAILILAWRILPRSLPGQLFWHLVMLFSLSVLLLEGFRANSTTWLVGIRIPQVIALVALLVTLYVLPFYALLQEKNDNEEPRQLADQANPLQANR